MIDSETSRIRQGLGEGVWSPQWLVVSRPRWRVFSRSRCGKHAGALEATQLGVMGNILATRAFRALFPRGHAATAAWLAAVSAGHPACFPREDLDAYSRGAEGGSGSGVSTDLPDDSGCDSVGGAAQPSPSDGSLGGAGNEGPDLDTTLDPGTGSDDGSADCTSDCEASNGGASAATDAGAPASSDAGPDSAAPPAPLCAPDERAGPRGRCHVAVGTLVSWQDARAACLARGPGWDLASVRSRADNDFVRSFLIQEAWFGGSDIAAEETWVWASDGLPFWQGEGPEGAPLNGAFFNWFDDEPNGGEGSDCLRLLLDGRWADLECDELRGYVCEGPPEGF